MQLNDKNKKILSKIKNSNIKDIEIINDSEIKSTYCFYWGETMPKQPTNKELLMLIFQDVKELKSDMVEVKDRLTNVENRLTNIESEAIKHGWTINTTN